MENLSENKAGSSFQKYPIAWVLIGIGICGIFFLTTRSFQVKQNLQKEIPITIAPENQDLPHQAHFDTANTMAMNSDNLERETVSKPAKHLTKSVETPEAKIFHEKVATDKFATRFGQIEPMKQLDTLKQISPIHEIQPQITPR